MAQVKLDTLVNFTTQFSSTVSANIPLMKILINLEKDVLDIKFAKILANIRSDVEKGYDLANSLKKHPEAFDAICVNMVKIKSALSYPKFMGIAMVLIMSLMLIKVISMFEKMFNNSKQELPQLTRMIICLSDILRNNLFLIIIFIIVSYLSFKIYTKTTNDKRTIDKLKISLPYIGTLNKKSSISKFIRTLGVLTISDIPILKAIKLSKSSSANVLIEEKIEEITLMIEKGYGIAEAFKKTDIFPDIIIQMIGSGEESGQLGELLISSANYYDDQIDNELKSTIGLINPIMTVFMGLFIATLMLAIFMPIFQMGDMY